MIGSINSFVTKVVDTVKAPIYSLGPKIVPEIKFSKTKKSAKKVVRRRRR